MTSWDTNSTAPIVPQCVWVTSANTSNSTNGNTTVCDVLPPFPEKREWFPPKPKEPIPANRFERRRAAKLRKKKK